MSRLVYDSAHAVRRVIEWSKTDQKLSEAVTRLKFRRARILSDTTLVKMLENHSSRSNAINDTMEYKSCFLDSVVHARRQYVMCDRPTKPREGDNKAAAPEFKVNSCYYLFWNGM